MPPLCELVMVNSLDSPPQQVTALGEGPFGWNNVPQGYAYRFCSCKNIVYPKHTKDWKFPAYDKETSFWVCVNCGLPKVFCWPIHIFECDNCEDLYWVKKNPDLMYLCEVCNA